MAPEPRCPICQSPVKMGTRDATTYADCHACRTTIYFWAWGTRDALEELSKIPDPSSPCPTPSKENDRLREEVASLRNRIGDGLCWFTEGDPIPPKEEFLQSCERYHAQIATKHGVLQGGKTIAQLEADNERLRDTCASLLRCSKGHIHNQPHGSRCPICEYEANRSSVIREEVPPPVVALDPDLDYSELVKKLTSNIADLFRAKREFANLEYQAALRTENAILRKRLDYEDAMIAHRWFAEEFGESMNGRDFATKCAMATRMLHEAGIAGEFAPPRSSLDDLVSRLKIRGPQFEGSRVSRLEQICFEAGIEALAEELKKEGA